ncbi:MAG: hypothetical protein KIT43_00245 [Bauldia sp.]|nr:hypothetical protein [Bauldia sp.]MCW5718026.1 hypothetical protein [Bauldia sp.]
MDGQGTGWDSQLAIGSGEGSARETADSKLILARMMKYCEDEAQALNLPFVAYCLSLAMGALAEHVDDLDAGWSHAQRLPRRAD